MTRGFLFILSFLLAAQILCSLGDPRTQKFLKRREVKHDESRSKRLDLRNHKNQTRAKVQGKHVHVPKEQSKGNENFVNLESVLFDREQLKNYVLDYLRTHGLAQNTESEATGDQNSAGHRKRLAGRLRGHHDKLQSKIYTDNGKHVRKNQKSRVNQHTSDTLYDDHSASKRNSLDQKTKRDGGHGVYRDKLQTETPSGVKAKHKHKHHGSHESDKSDSLAKDHFSNKFNFASKEESHHHQPQEYDRHQFEGHHSERKYPFPIYYRVTEEDNKDHQHVETKAKQRMFEEGRKHSADSKQVDSKRKKRVESHHTTEQQGRKRGKNTNNVSSLHTLPHPLHKGEAKYKKESEGKKQAAKQSDRIHQVHEHNFKSAGSGNLKKVSKADASRYNLKHKDNHNDNKGSNRTKSNKRDFIAVLPPQSFKLEGFDVEPVHLALHDKRKRKASRRQRHLHAKKNESHKQATGQKAKRKNIVTSKSRVRKKSQRPEAGRKSTVAQISSKTDHRKKSESTFHKQSSEKKQKSRRKSTVTSKLHRNDHDVRKGKGQKEERGKSTVAQKSLKNDHRGKSDSAVQKNSGKEKANRKSAFVPSSSKHHSHKTEHHDLGDKKSIVHREEKATAHKRKKASRHQDSKELKFSPSWESLDKRKIPSWYDDAKFGIFVHWGVYSAPSFDSEWFWYKWKGKHLQKYLNYIEKNFPPGFSYTEFAPLFKAEFFDAKQWAELVARSGARYFVFTSKHHEGFTNWNSSVTWNWNSVDVGPHRNIVDELAKAFRNLSDPQVRFGLYYSLFEWFNPHYLKDKANGFKTDEYIKAVMRPQLYDLVNTYKPDYLWTDGDWEAKDSYWKSKEFLAWLFNESPVKDTVVVNDRWGRGCRCIHGGVFTGRDRYNPGKLQKMKWENAMTIDRHSWGFRRDAKLKDYLGIEELIMQLVTTVSCGGNLLMNVGPAADGTISPIFQERLTQMGDWLKVNGDAIYKTRPWRAQNDSVSGDVWYTSKDKLVFAIALTWPRSGKLVLGDPTATPQTRVTMLGTKPHLKWTHASKHKGGIVIHVPAIPVSDLPCLWAWVFKLSHVK